MSSDVRRRTTGLFAVAGSAVAFSWAFTIVKAIDLAGPSLGLWRLIIGALGFTTLTLLFRERWPKYWRPTIVAGLLMGCHQLLYITAVQQTSIAIVTLIGAMLPLLVGLLAPFVVKERFRWPIILWSLVAVGGIGVVVQASLGSASRSLTGDLLALANMVVLSFYFLAAKKARDGGIGTLAFTSSVLWLAMLIVAPVALVQGFGRPSAGDLGLLCVLALGSGSGHLWVNWALPRVTATIAVLTLSIVPLLASLWAYLVHDEPFGVRHLIGIVVVAIFLAQRSSRP